MQRGSITALADQDVHFNDSKVDVSAAVRNQRLLDGYVGLRALSPASLEGITSALASFTRHAEAPRSSPPCGGERSGSWTSTPPTSS